MGGIDKSAPASAPLPRIGAVVVAADAPSLIRELLPRGFESFEIEFWESVGAVDLAALADEVAAALAASGGRVSSVGVYGNTLDPASPTLSSLRALIEAAGSFGSPVVSCFAGRTPGASVPDSLEKWREVYGALAESASAKGLVLALENCRLGDSWKTGKWNIAINPDAWELLFAALPGAPIGLEWEPCHQILAFADPLAQLEAWAGRVVHVHGKDARLDRRALALRGAYGSTKTGHEALPGQGDAPWPELMGVLSRSGFSGSVDIELPAKSEYRSGRQVEGYSLGLVALREARDAASRR